MAKEFLTLKKQTIVDIANAVRLKTNSDKTIKVEDLDSAIGEIKPTGELEITENGEYDVVDCAKIIVNVVNSTTNCIINYNLSYYTYMVVDNVTYNNESGTLTVPSGTKINFKCSNNAASPADLHTKITLDGTIVAEYQGYASGSSEGEIEYELEINSNITVSGVDVETPYIDCGQITITTQSSSSNGYTVIVSSDAMYGFYGYYSLDNGATWENFYDLSYDDTVGGLLITNVTQIKFKVDDRAYNNGIYVNIDCEQLNLALAETGPLESENFTLTSDISVSYYDMDY